MTDNKKKEIKDLIDRLLGLVENHSVKSDGLSCGKTGLALAYIYYGSCFHEYEYCYKGLGLIEEILQNIESENSILRSMDLYSGLCGFLQVVNSVCKSGLLEIDMQDFSSLEALLYDWTMSEVRKDNHDFLLGPMGSLNYFINRLPNAGAEVFVKNILTVIVTKIEKNPSNGFSLKNTYYNKIDHRTVNEINYSLAHGMSSLILNLIRLDTKGDQFGSLNDTAYSMIDQFIKLNKDKNPSYPACFIGSFDCDNNDILLQKRLGWCFSSLNIVQILLEYKNRSGDPVFDQLIDESTDHLTKRLDFADTLVNDAYLCHGALGIALYYCHLKSLNGDVRFREAEDHWLTYGIDYYKKVGDEHFSASDFTSTGDISSFFYGPLGSMLCLISLYDNNLMDWSEIILL
ncbi:MAG: hypothetical protein JWR38_4301 [Mucilaginibacter sp.]|nr:hypothetical protein [Mucilaginibacter sp.]